MGVDGASTRPGANIGQYNCGKAAPNQSWVLPSDTEDLMRNMTNSKSKLCIGVDHANTANGVQLKQFACNYQAPNQECRSYSLAESPLEDHEVALGGVEGGDHGSATPRITGRYHGWVTYSVIARLLAGRVIS
jgi:hypothetical protein